MCFLGCSGFSNVSGVLLDIEQDCAQIVEASKELFHKAWRQTVPDGGERAGPREYGSFTRWAMKPVCSLLFNRKTVAYFSAAPLRMSSLCFFDVAKHPKVRGHVALTFDDAPCRGGADLSELPAVLDTLARFDAKATFMVVGAWTEGQEGDLAEALRRGHELGNHAMQDRRYDMDSPAHFAQAVEDCSSRIRAVQRAAGMREEVNWFRAPHGKYTQVMADALAAKGLRNVMCDTYASCPIIQDGEFIGSFLTNSSQDGSIILLHMPERNFRQWCGNALVPLLEGLQKRGLKPVTVGQLSALAESA